MSANLEENLYEDSTFWDIKLCALMEVNWHFRTEEQAAYRRTKDFIG
jgi:hypothetical protein